MSVDKAKVEVKWWSGSDWEETYLVKAIHREYPAYLCPMPESDLFTIVGYGSGGVAIEYIGGDEKPAYDVRINEGLSVRERWDTGRCDGHS